MKAKLTLNCSEGRFTKPVNFKPAGKVTNVRLLPKVPGFVVKAKNRKKRGSALAGLKYEKEVAIHIEKLYPKRFVRGPWITFESSEYSNTRYCQPDGLIFNPKTRIVTIVEVKLRHTIRAWWQLRQLYEPVLRVLFKDCNWKISVCEVIKYYQPGVSLPEEFKFTPTIQLHGDPLDLFRIHKWEQGKLG